MGRTCLWVLSKLKPARTWRQTHSSAEYLGSWLVVCTWTFPLAWVRKPLSLLTHMGMGQQGWGPTLLYWSREDKNAAPFDNSLLLWQTSHRGGVDSSHHAQANARKAFERQRREHPVTQLVWQQITVPKLSLRIVGKAASDCWDVSGET